MTDFFIFNSKLISSTFQAQPLNLDQNGSQEGLFDHHRLIMGNYENIQFPVIFVQEYGTKLLDILDTGHANLFLISDKLREILMKNQLTGWKTFPVQIFDKKENEIYQYHGFSITGRCGPLNFAKSEIIEKRQRPAAPLRKYFRGLVFEQEQWDGADFFLSQGWFFVIITSKVADILNKSNISNLDLMNVSNVEISITDI